MIHMKNVLWGFVLLFGTVANSPAQRYAIKSEKVYTMTQSAPIANGLVLVKDGKIEWVGAANDHAVPKDYTVLTAKVVTPGLIDAHGVVGLAGALNQPHDQDQLETSGNVISPELRALDAYNTRDILVNWLLQFGVTTIHTGHGPGALVSGQTMVVKTLGDDVGRALVDSSSMLAITLGPSVSGNFKSPGTRAKGVAMLRSELIKAQTYKRKMENPDATKRPERDLRMEALMHVLNGQLNALLTVDQTQDILAAIRVAQEFGLKLVLDSVAEAYLVPDAIKASGAEVILHPTMKRAAGEAENLSFETAGKLYKAGIAFSMQSGYEGYVPKTRVVLFEAAQAIRYGLPYEAALASVTINPAKLLGIDHRVGSLAAGKDADVVLYDGDPFEYTTHVCTVLVNGKLGSETCH